MINGVPTVTVKVGTPVTFMATATAGTATPDTYWTVKSGPAYQWQDYEVETPDKAATTTFSKTYDTPGTYTMQMRCQVSYTCQYVRGGIAGASQMAEQNVTINVIGGPISGDQDEYFFCSDNLPGGSIDALGYLNAAPGQPAGTTYSWSISGSAIYCDGDGNPTTPTGAAVKYRGKLPGSSAVGDVKANATYTLNGVSAKSSPDYSITVHVPKTFTIKSYTPAVKYAYGFSGQSITFEVRDSVNQLYPPGKAYWSESWTQVGTNGGGQPTQYGGGP